MFCFWSNQIMKRLHVEAKRKQWQKHQAQPSRKSETKCNQKSRNEESCNKESRSEGSRRTGQQRRDKYVITSRVCLFKSTGDKQMFEQLLGVLFYARFRGAVINKPKGLPRPLQNLCLGDWECLSLKMGDVTNKTLARCKQRN